jgi:hypothetical protein
MRPSIYLLTTRSHTQRYVCNVYLENSFTLHVARLREILTASGLKTIKGLTDKLDREVDKVAPRQRFQFKARSRNAAQAAKEDRRHNVGVLASYPETQQGSAPPPREKASTPSEKDYNQELKASSSTATIRRPSFSAAKTISLSGHRNLHIVLPPSAAQAATYGDLTDLEGCVVDMSSPASGATAFSGLALKNVRRCIVVTGSVAGPVHVTGVSDSILVVASRQVRIHECRNVDFYLHCSSHPIIEDCTRVRFAPIPECYVCLFGPVLSFLPSRVAIANSGERRLRGRVPMRISGIRSTTSSG